MSRWVVIARMAALLAALLVAMGRSGLAQSDFSGKTIRLYIGTGPGGGYDTYGRLVARHIGRHIPGNPAVVAQNMPRTSSLALPPFLFNPPPRAAPPPTPPNQSLPPPHHLAPLTPPSP